MIILRGHTRVVHSIAFSTDGSELVSSSGDRTIRLWECSTATARHKWTGQFWWGGRVSYSSDGNWIAANKHDEIRVYDACKGVLAKILRIHPSFYVSAIFFSPDGHYLIAVGSGEQGPRWFTWTPENWDANPSTKVADTGLGVRNATITCDGNFLAIIGFPDLELWDFSTGTQIRGMPNPIRNGGSSPMPLAFSRNGSLLAYGHGARMQIVDVAHWQRVGEIQLERKHFLDAAFSPDGRYLATVSNEETVKFWSTSTWQVVTEFAWKIGGLKCIAFSPDGLRAACGGERGKIVVWDIDD